MLSHWERLELVYRLLEKIELEKEEKPEARKGETESGVSPEKFWKAY